MIMNYGGLVEVKIADIDSDESFKVSKKSFQNTLPASLRLSGMLEVPYIIKKGSGYSMFTCHNRISILRESGVAGLKCFILDEPDVDVFMNHVSLKAYRNELGPMGRIKALSLLNFYFNVNDTLKKNFCTKVLKLPFEILEKEEYLNKVTAFPAALASFLDEKDINFKIIKDLSLLPDIWINVVDSWIKNIQMRVNIFRMLIDFVFDIYRRGDSISAIESILFIDDKTLYDNVYRLRYPGYSKLKTKSDSITGELSGTGLTIEFPEYFDRSFVTVKLDIDKNLDCAAQLKKISEIDIEKMKELLSLL